MTKKRRANQPRGVGGHRNDSAPILLGCNRKIEVLGVLQKKGRNSYESAL
jgi:hypothetical protein